MNDFVVVQKLESSTQLKNDVPDLLFLEHAFGVLDFVDLVF